MSKQKFKRGDHIKIADDLGKSMAHFQSGVEGIVIGSYADKYGGKTIDSYTIHIKGHGQVSWYYENQLTLIKKGRIDLLEVWEKEAADLKTKERDLDWIFSPEHAHENFQLPGESAQALADELKLGSLWGRSGEGLTWQRNYAVINQSAGIFVRTGDRAGFEIFKASVLADPNKPAPKVMREPSTR
jgi:hypothetical protein